MNLTEDTISCPYCGELVDVLLDHTDANQEYIEDCQVCCRPITFSVVLATDGDPNVSVRSEDETY